MQKVSEGDDLEPDENIAIVKKNEIALAALQSGEANVLGGTSWLWTPLESLESVDALFIDEAGQMALADVVALGQAGENIFLIGDPQQLERPVKGSHPDGAEKSALEHLIGDHKTIPEGLGMLLPETWRMHPEICKFTSELFYEGRLHSRDALKNRVLADHRVAERRRPLVCPRPARRQSQLCRRRSRSHRQNRVQPDHRPSPLVPRYRPSQNRRTR